MKNIFTFFTVFLLLAAQSCTTFSKKENQDFEIRKDSIAKNLTETNSFEIDSSSITQSNSDTLTGDFNGDGKKEQFWLELPKLASNDAEQFCLDSNCTALAKFSNAAINSFEIKNSAFVFIENLGDLDFDGTDEIGICPTLFTSCWHKYHVWTYKNNHWKESIEPFTFNTCDYSFLTKEGKTYTIVKRDPKRKGNVIIKESKGELGLVEKSVKMN